MKRNAVFLPHRRPFSSSSDRLSEDGAVPREFDERLLYRNCAPRSPSSPVKRTLVKCSRARIMPPTCWSAVVQR